MGDGLKRAPHCAECKTALAAAPHDQEAEAPACRQ
jgi:hypothetical protein